VLLMLFLVWGTVRAEELTLDSCLTMARRNNPELRKAELSVRRAEQVKAQALTKYFPQVQATAFGYHALHPIVDIGIDDIGNASVRDLLTTLYGNYGAALGLENTINLFRYGYSVGVTAIQPVFVGGKIVAGNRLAQVGVEAAKLQAQMNERDILEQVEETYWLVYGLQQKQRIIDEATALLDTVYTTVSGAVTAGLALPNDLAKVAIRRDEVARQQLQLTSGMRLAKRALALSVGMADADSISIAETDSALVEEWSLNENVGESYEQQLLALQVRAVELEKRMVLADALPQVAVGANYGYGYLQTNLLRNGISNPNGNGAVFVTVNVPLTAWWETGHKLREKQYALEQARIDAEFLGTQLDLRTTQAYDQMNDAAAMVRIQQQTVAHAQESYDHTEANYQAGRATVADWLQAQMTLTQAQAELTDAQIAYRVRCRRYRDLVAGNK